AKRAGGGGGGGRAPHPRGGAHFFPAPPPVRRGFAPRLTPLSAEGGRARGAGAFPRLFRMLTRVDLLILDDLGPDRLTAGQRRDLMEIVEERHARSSTLLASASQLPVKAWHDVIGEPTYADAILDRLVTNAHR